MVETFQLSLFGLYSAS